MCDGRGAISFPIPWSRRVFATGVAPCVFQISGSREVLAKSRGDVFVLQRAWRHASFKFPEQRAWRHVLLISPEPGCLGSQAAAGVGAAARVAQNCRQGVAFLP